MTLAERLLDEIRRSGASEVAGFKVQLRDGQVITVHSTDDPRLRQDIGPNGEGVLSVTKLQSAQAGGGLTVARLLAI